MLARTITAMRSWVLETAAVLLLLLGPTCSVGQRPSDGQGPSERPASSAGGGGGALAGRPPPVLPSPSCMLNNESCPIPRGWDVDWSVANSTALMSVLCSSEGFNPKHRWAP